MFDTEIRKRKRFTPMNEKGLMHSFPDDMESLYPSLALAK
jgi:hypothetical protein